MKGSSDSSNPPPSPPAAEDSPPPSPSPEIDSPLPELKPFYVCSDSDAEFRVKRTCRNWRVFPRTERGSYYDFTPTDPVVGLLFGSQYKPYVYAAGDKVEGIGCLPSPQQRLSPPLTPKQDPIADGLVPWLGSHLDLPPGDVMPPGVLGFVFDFSDDTVVRTGARKAYIVGGLIATHSMDPVIDLRDSISIGDRMDITFPLGGRIIVSDGGFIFVQNRPPMFAPDGCQIDVPVGGVAEFHICAEHIDTSTAPV